MDTSSRPNEQLAGFNRAKRQIGFSRRPVLFFDSSRRGFREAINV